MRPARESDVDKLAYRMREADVQECLAGAGHSPWQSLEMSRRVSDPCMTVTQHELPCAMFGVLVEHEEGVDRGRVWMLGSDDLLGFWRLFLRESPVWLDRMAAGCDLTWNVVDSRNVVHVKWLQWLGFRFVAVHEHFGVERRPFYEFVRIEVANVQRRRDDGARDIRRNRRNRQQHLRAKGE